MVTDERRGCVVSQILKGVHCSYSMNLKLMVVKLMGEMNGHAVTWIFGNTHVNV